MGEAEPLGAGGSGEGMSSAGSGGSRAAEQDEPTLEDPRRVALEGSSGCEFLASCCQQRNYPDSCYEKLETAATLDEVEGESLCVREVNWQLAATHCGPAVDVDIKLLLQTSAGETKEARCEYGEIVLHLAYVEDRQLADLRCNFYADGDGISFGFVVPTIVGEYESVESSEIRDSTAPSLIGVYATWESQDGRGYSRFPGARPALAKVTSFDKETRRLEGQMSAVLKASGEQGGAADLTVTFDVELPAPFETP